MPTYKFALTIMAEMSVSADSEDEARDKLTLLFMNHSMNCGMLDGEPIILQG